MVVFCKGSSLSAVTFRQPASADFLGSGSRQVYMVPNIDVPLEAVDRADMTDLLRVNNTMRMIGAQKESAVSHWKVMRTVLPPKIWELW